jgi:autotransporter-associated beta strand protein
MNLRLYSPSFVLLCLGGLTASPTGASCFTVSETASVVLSANTTFDMTNHDLLVRGLVGPATGTIIIEGAILTLKQNGPDLSYQGALIGDGDLIKTGIGEQIFQETPKTYTGETVIDQGRLTVTPDGVMSHTAGVRLLGTGSAASDGLLVFKSSGAYIFGGELLVPPPVILEGGGLAAFSTGEATLANAVQVSASPGGRLIAGEVDEGPSGVVLRLEGALSGPGTLRREGPGEVILAGNGTSFAGPLLLRGGLTTIPTGTALGNGGITVTIAGTDSANPARLRGPGTIAGNLTYGAHSRIDATELSGVTQVTGNLDLGTAHVDASAVADGRYDLFEVGGASHLENASITPSAALIARLGNRICVVKGIYTDSDANGLPDVWEITYFGSLEVNPAADPENDGLTNLQEYQSGTNPTVDDAMDDLDGDGIPNIFEQRHGTDPADSGDWATAHRRIDPSDPGAYATIQAAINAAANFDIIAIAAGTYSGSGNHALSTGGKSVLLLAEDGPGSVIIDLAGNNTGLYASGGNVALVGITWHRPYSTALQFSGVRSFLKDVTVREGVSTSAAVHSTSSPPSYASNVSVVGGLNGGVYLSNSHLTLDRFFYMANSPGSYGALYVSSGARLWLRDAVVADNRTSNFLLYFQSGTTQVELVNTCILRNRVQTSYLVYNGAGTVAFDHVTSAANRITGTGYSYLYTGNGFTARNSIFYNEEGANEFGGNAPTLSHVIVRGGGSGVSVLDVDPKLVHSGHLRHDSPAIDAGLVIPGLDWDIDEEMRPEGSAPDFGADEWVADATHPLLPTWYVALHGLSASTGDADGDGLSDFDEYLHGTDPNATDSDGDGLSDAAEIILGTHPLRVDTDEDGMPDGWEVTHGLNPLVDDAFGDLDRDGVPNIFEFLKTTDPTDPGSTPTASRRVDITGSGGAHLTIQAAISAASDYDIIDIAAGAYSGSGNRNLSISGKRLLFRGEGGSAAVTLNLERDYSGFSSNADLALSGISFHRPSSGAINASNIRLLLHDVRITEGWSQGSHAISLSSVRGSIDGLTIENGRLGGIYAGSSIMEIRDYVYRYNTTQSSYGAFYADSSSLVLRDFSATDNTSLYTLAQWNYGTFDSLNAVILRNRVSQGYLLRHAYADGALRHATVAFNQVASGYTYLSRTSGTLVAENVIFYNETGAAEFGGTVPTLSHAIVRGGATGTAVQNVDPLLTRSGHLRHDSPAIDSGLIISGIGTDIDVENRPAGTAPDIGADEWVADVTHVQLPAWFVSLYGLGSSTGDADGDGLSDVDEYLNGMDPSLADTDGDGLSDNVEITAGTDPRRADTDGDGMPDGWEVAQGLDPLRDDAMEDLDGDGYPNLFEYVYGTDANDDASRPVPDLVVDPSGLEDYTRISDAAYQARNYGADFTIIEVAPGIYVGDSSFTVGSDHRRVLLVARDGPENTIIDGLSIYETWARTALYVQGGSGVSGFTIHRFTGDVLYTYGNEERSYLHNLRLKKLGRVEDTYWAPATGLYLSDAGAIIRDVFIEDIYGYGSYSDAVLVEMQNVRFSHGIGGCAINQQSGTLRLKDVDIADWENIAADRFSAQPLIRLVGAQAEWSGGKISRSASAGTEPLVQSEGVFHGENLLFRNNRGHGGLWWQASGTTTLAFSTFWQNTNTHPTHTVFRRSGTLGLDHVILWTESATAELPAGVTAEYSFIRDGYAGTGNSAVNPGLTPAGRMTLASPARGAGLTGAAPEVDFEGDPRSSGSAPDVGADHYHDSDANDLPDGWELDYFGTLVNDANADLDNDGLINLDEFLHGTDPLLADTDGDSLRDGWEVHLYGSDPLLADAHLVLVDLNGDGIPDGPGAQVGIDPTKNDHDGDGISNEDELRFGLDPFNADTDGDGVNDDVDLYPTDPTRHSLPPPDPGDTTPPVITLTEPADAVLLP